MRALCCRKSGFPAAPPKPVSWWGMGTWLALPPHCSGWGVAPSSHSWSTSWQPLHNPWNYCQASLLCEHPQSSYVLSLKPTSKMCCFQSSKESSTTPEGKHSLASLLPSFPFPLSHCWILLHWRAAALAEPLTSPPQCEIGVMTPPSPATSPVQGLGRASGCTGSALNPGALQDTPGLLLALVPLLPPSLGPEGHGVWGSQAGSSASKIA